MEPHHQVHHRSIIIIIIIIRWRSQSVRPARKCLMGREGSQWDVGNRFLLLPRLLKLATKFDGFLMWVVSFPLKMWNMYVVMNRDVVLGFLLASASTLNPRLGVVVNVLEWKIFMCSFFCCFLYFFQVFINYSTYHGYSNTEHWCCLGVLTRRTWSRLQWENNFKKWRFP